MKLLRFAVAEFSPAIPRMACWTSDIGDGVQVRIDLPESTEAVELGRPEPIGPVLVTGHEGASQAMLTAAVKTEVKQVSPVELSFDDEPRIRAEAGLRLTSASLAVQSQSACRLYSPTPYLALEGECVDDRTLLEQCIRIRMPALKAFQPLAGVGLEWPQDLAQLRDRREGLLLLGAAMTAAHGVSKLHELFRLFENAFAAAGARLIDPLANFLSSHPWNLGYTWDEVAGWVNDLRHPAIHADLARQAFVASDRDVQPYLLRIEQAALDVLFNKDVWHSDHAARQERIPLRCAVTSTGSLIQSDGAHMRTFSGWDLHQSFQLRGRIDFERSEEPEFGLKVARWHFTEAERASLAKNGVIDS